MSKIPTAEEFFKKYSDYTSLSEGHYDYLIEEDSFKESMIEFAKLHVEAALKEAKERCDDSTNSEGLGEYIEKAYPLENIK